MSFTAPDVEIKFKQGMGDELGLLFSYLWGDYLMLHQKWNEYIELFATNEKRLELLNETAPGFFRMVQDLFWQATLISLCRISDQVGTG